MFERIGKGGEALPDAEQFVVDVLHVKFLSYKIPACHTDRMNREPKWKTRALAVEFWLLTALVAGSFVVGLVSAIRYLTG